MLLFIIVQNDLELRITSEQIANDLTGEVLNSVEPGAELAGDGLALKEPGK